MSPGDNKDTGSSATSATETFEIPSALKPKHTSYWVLSTEEEVKESLIVAKSSFGFDIDKLAKLSNLIITDEERDLYALQLLKVLNFISSINEVNIMHIEPTFNVSGQENIVQKDEVGDCSLSSDEALSNAPQKKDGFFVTGGVFNNE